MRGNGVTTQTISLRATQAAQLAAGPVFPSILSDPADRNQLRRFQHPVRGAQLENALFRARHCSRWSAQLRNDLTITASYVWSRGIQLYSERDLNLPPLRIYYLHLHH